MRIDPTGNYSMGASASEFFMSKTMRLIARDTRIFGRFGRRGSIRGTITRYVAHVTWRDLHREGWMMLVFATDFGSGLCRYGLLEGQVLGESTLTRIIRRHRASVA